jgi:Protein of unknown function (DUF3253)
MTEKYAKRALSQFTRARTLVHVSFINSLLEAARAASFFLARRTSTRSMSVDIPKTILTLLAERAPEASICPSDVARELAPEDEERWRALMPQIRAVAARMAAAQRIRITRGEAQLDPGDLSGGPIRLRRGDRFSP